MKILFTVVMLISCLFSQAQKQFRSATSSILSNPITYDKLATDTAIAGAVKRAIADYDKIQKQVDAKQDQANIAQSKAFADTIKVLRDSIAAFRPVIFGDGFTVVSGKATDTIKNTVSLNLKDINSKIDSSFSAIKGLKDALVNGLKSITDKSISDSTSLALYKKNNDQKVSALESWKAGVIDVLLDFVNKMEAMRKSIPNGLQYPIN